MSTHKNVSLMFILVLASMSAAAVVGQTPPAPAEPSSSPARIRRPRTPVAEGRSSAVVFENAAVAPQVVTILHRLNGLKVFRLLLRSNDELGAIERLDQTFRFQGGVHTNVIAGLALDDQTIAAWLPEVEAEIPPPAIPPTPQPAPRAAGTVASAGVYVPRNKSITGTVVGMPPETADLRVVLRDGKKITARYVGLDGMTGLSVIVLTHKGSSQVTDLREETVSVGQSVRLVGPEPADSSEMGGRSAMYVRIGETPASVSYVKRSPNGTIARLKIKSETLTPASIGRIAINDAGNTLGIVDAVEGGEATLVPVGLVRNAVSRVIARQSSVPRPWLGVRGEPIGDRSLDRMTSGGWELERARALTEKRQGILLTSITPGSPAALAQLRPGDVILSVNNGDIKNAEDFSWLLEQAGPGSSVKFTVARPDKVVAEALAIKLSESPDPFFGLKQIERYKKLVKPGSLMAQGIETIRLMPQAAAGFGGNGGLLVVYVKPTAAAYKAGLRAGDLIEAIDGHQVGAAAPLLFLNKPGAGATFTVVRKKERLFLKVPAADTP